MRNILLLAALVPTALSAKPPRGATAPKWVVNYSPDSCEVLRPRVDGQSGLLLRMRPHTTYYELKMIGAPTGRKTDMEVIVLSAPAIASKYPQIGGFGDTPDGKHGLVQTVVTVEQVVKAAADGRLTATGTKLGEMSVSTAGLAKAMAAADRCVTDLAMRWGAPKSWANDPQPLADPRSVFTADDYPWQMRDRGRSGSLRTLLGIGADGKITSCRPIELVGDPMFGEVTCDILKKRARYAPATDATGRAVPSFSLAPPVHWRLSF